MPTRSRGTSARTPKSPPPFGGSALEDEDEGGRREAAREESAEQSSANAAITGGSLERREIPSLSEDREQRIAEAAYWRAERRGFEPGHELDDWLEAEREVDAQKSDPSLDQRPDGRTA